MVVSNGETKSIVSKWVGRKVSVCVVLTSKKKKQGLSIMCEPKELLFFK